MSDFTAQTADGGALPAGGFGGGPPMATPGPRDFLRAVLQASKESGYQLPKGELMKLVTAAIEQEGRNRMPQSFKLGEIPGIYSPYTGAFQIDPLYAHPPAATPQGLSDEQLQAMKKAKLELDGVTLNAKGQPVFRFTKPDANAPTATVAAYWKAVDDFQEAARLYRRTLADKDLANLNELQKEMRRRARLAGIPEAEIPTDRTESAPAPGAAAPTAKPAAPAPAANAAPQVGEVRRGYRFKGGDPSKPENWEKVP